jgi:hypothetical protein
VHTNPDSNIDLDKDGFSFAAGVRNYLDNEYKDPMTTTREMAKWSKELEEKQKELDAIPAN